MRNDGSSKLPEAEGKITGKNVGLGGYKFARELGIDVRVAADQIDVSHLEMGFADGKVTLDKVHIEPLRPGGARSASRRWMGRTCSSLALMRDLDVTSRTIVGWDIHETHARKIHGTFAPLHVEGELSGDTRDFEVFDRSWKDPARKHMIGVKRASLHGHFRVLSRALEFFDTRADFGKSSVAVRLVSIGFDNTIALNIGYKESLSISPT